MLLQHHRSRVCRENRKISHNAGLCYLRGYAIGKKINASLVQGFVWQDKLRIAAELDGNHNTIARFAYGDKPNVPELMEKGGKRYRIITDHLGSVRLVVDAATGAIAQRMDYDAWGQVTQDSNPGFQPFGYAGGLYEAATGLTRFGARDYDAQTGRWTAKDPIGFGGGDGNLFGYANQNAISYSDPTGQLAFAIPFIPAIITGANLAIGAGLGILGYGLDRMTSSNLLPGFIPADKGAEQWGRNNGIDPNDARGRFHGIKQDDVGSRPRDKYGVNPQTGDVCDPNGDVVGNLGDRKRK